MVINYLLTGMILQVPIHEWLILMVCHVGIPTSLMDHGNHGIKPIKPHVPTNIHGPPFIFGSPPLQKLSHPQVLLNCSTPRKGGVFFHALFAKSSTLNAEKIIIEKYGAKHYRFTSDNSWRGRTDGPNDV